MLKDHNAVTPVRLEPAASRSLKSQVIFDLKSNIIFLVTISLCFKLMFLNGLGVCSGR